MGRRQGSAFRAEATARGPDGGMKLALFEARQEWPNMRSEDRQGPLSHSKGSGF